MEVRGGASDAALARLYSFQDCIVILVGVVNDDIRFNYGVIELMPDICRYLSGAKLSDTP